MTENEDGIVFLLKSLTRSGQLSSEEKLIDLQMRRPPENQVPPKLKERTIKKLEERQRELSEISAKTANPEMLHSLGEYLKLMRKSKKIDFSLLAESTKTEMTKIRLLEQDRVSPLDISYDEMARLIAFVGITKSAALSLIRKSCRLYKLRPQLEKASARYDQKLATHETQLDAMNSALKELLLRSTESISDPEVDNYLKELEQRLK